MNYVMEFFFHGIGDIVTTTSFPENYFAQTGKKIHIIDNNAKFWFQYNPYVIIGDASELESIFSIKMFVDSRVEEMVKKYTSYRGTQVASSQAEWIAFFGDLDINKLVLRHPRLYIHEDIKQEDRKLIVHTTGSKRSNVDEENIRYQLGEDAERILSDEIIEHILEKYSDWKIVQVGGKDDKPVGGHAIDMRGKLDLFDVAKEIASSMRFIGVNSGMMHIANCYPDVDKRIVLAEYPDFTILKGNEDTMKFPFMAGEIRNMNFSWLDCSYKYYNKYKRDLGTTYSFLKI
jgi:hypothetical protein